MKRRIKRDRVGQYVNYEEYLLGSDTQLGTSYVVVK